MKSRGPWTAGPRYLLRWSCHSILRISVGAGTLPLKPVTCHLLLLFRRLEQTLAFLCLRSPEGMFSSGRLTEVRQDQIYNNPLMRGLVSSLGGTAVVKLEVLLIAGRVNSRYGSDALSSICQKPLRDRRLPTAGACASPAGLNGVRPGSSASGRYQFGCGSALRRYWLR